MAWETRQVHIYQRSGYSLTGFLGIFLDKAQDLVKKPPITDDDRVHRFTFAVNDALSKGLTTLHDAGFDPASLAFFEKYYSLIYSAFDGLMNIGFYTCSADKRNLDSFPLVVINILVLDFMIHKQVSQIRIYGMTYFDENAEYWGDRRSKIIDNNRLTVRSVKIFADGRGSLCKLQFKTFTLLAHNVSGALRSGGVAVCTSPYTRKKLNIAYDQLYEPYADNPHTRGFMRIDPDVLHQVVPKFLKDGWQVVRIRVYVHCIASNY